jgi:hypothetical protein
MAGRLNGINCSHHCNTRIRMTSVAATAQHHAGASFNRAMHAGTNHVSNCWSVYKLSNPGQLSFASPWQILRRDDKAMVSVAWTRPSARTTILCSTHRRRVPENL